MRKDMHFCNLLAKIKHILKFNYILKKILIYIFYNAKKMMLKLIKFQNISETIN
jgi:hypothetical protein